MPPKAAPAVRGASPPKKVGGPAASGVGGRGLQRGASNLPSDWASEQASREEDAAHEAMMAEHHQQRHDAESAESVHRQRHEALEAVARKLLEIEWLRVSDPLAYAKRTKPCMHDDVAASRCTVKLMTCNRAMKPFAVAVALPSADSELDVLTLADLKQRVFEAAKSNFVDPVMLPLVQPHMQVLYNAAGKQIGRVDDVAAMERWIAAHPPPTKKLTAAEKAALPVPPPMPTIESPAAHVREFGVVPGATIYLGIRVAAPSVIGSDPNAEAEERPAIVASPPVIPARDGKIHAKSQQPKPATAASEKNTASAASNAAVTPQSQQRPRK